MPQGQRGLGAENERIHGIGASATMTSPPDVQGSTRDWRIVVSESAASTSHQGMSMRHHGNRVSSRGVSTVVLAE